MRKFGPSLPPIDVVVDEKWYLSQYPDVKSGLAKGLFRSAKEHFIKYGYREGRVPLRPRFNENWYTETYPDVASAIREGRVKSGYDHFIENGYGEGRKPSNAPEPYEMPVAARGLTSFAERLFKAG